MNSWVLFVARRLLTAGRRRGRGAGTLAIFGVAAGVATLVAVLAVMNGFQLGTIESILEVNSYHLRVETNRTPAQDPQPLEELQRQIRGLRGVAVVSPVLEIQTLARGFWPETEGIVLRAVPPRWLQDDPGAAERLEVVAGTFDLTRPSTVVLGTELARSLAVRPGDAISVTHIPGGGTRPTEQELVVTGVFRTGYLDFDRTWGFISLGTAVTALDAQDRITLGIKLDNRFGDLTAAGQISGLTEFPVVSWREYNRGIFGALRVEKAMMVFLIGMMFLVVAGNIYQLLRRSVMERSEEIAIMRALGASPRQVRNVFVLEGWMIGLVGTLTGTIAGVTLSVNVNGIFDLLEMITSLLSDQGVRVFSPAYFYLLEVPVRILPEELFLIAFGSLGISVAAATIAARSVGTSGPMEILRSE